MVLPRPRTLGGSGRDRCLSLHHRERGVASCPGAAEPADAKD